MKGSSSTNIHIFESNYKYTFSYFRECSGIFKFYKNGRKIFVRTFAFIFVREIE